MTEKQVINAALTRAKKQTATAKDVDKWQFHAEQLKKMLTQAGLTRGRPKMTWKKRWRMIQ